MLWVLIPTVHLTVCSYHVTYTFQYESTLYSCSKQARYLKFKWLQQDSNPQPLSWSTNNQPFSETGQMIEPCCEYLSVRYVSYLLLAAKGFNTDLVQFLPPYHVIISNVGLMTMSIGFLCVPPLNRSSHQRCSLEEPVLIKLAIFAGKHLCWSLFLIKCRSEVLFSYEHLFWRTSLNGFFCLRFCWANCDISLLISLLYGPFLVYICV